MHRSAGFGAYSDRVLSLMNTCFSTYYNRIAKRYWHNQDYTRMVRAYQRTDWDKGKYEVYLPTFHDRERNLGYYRIHIQTQPELDSDTATQLTEAAHAKMVSPAGVQDSELIVLVSPYRKRGFTGFIRGKRLPLHGFQANVITPNPEEAIRRILKLVTNFLRRRIRTFLDSFNLDWFWGVEERLYYSTNSLSKIESVLDHHVNGLRCLSHGLSWFMRKLRDLHGEIQRQINIIKATKMFMELQPVLHDIKYAPQYMRESEPFLIHELLPIAGVWR